MSNKICYDFLTFTSKIHSTTSIIQLLGLEDVTFETLKGFYGYRDRLYFDGISIHYNGREDMGICIELSGKGCRTFETFGTGDYDSIFSEILDNYNDNSELRQMNITRIDIAYDDFSGVLDLDRLSSDTLDHNFSSRFKDYQVISGNKGKAVNHGSNKSNVYIRCYDKRLEQNVQDKIDHWIRLELQIRAECALGFIKMTEPIEDKYFYVLNRYLRYLVPSSNTTNRSMVATAPYWLNFIENTEDRAIFCKPADNYNVLKLRSFITEQVSGAVSTYIDIFGVNQFLVDVQNARKGKTLNSKYKALKQENNAPGSGILKYLAEHGLE